MKLDLSKLKKVREDGKSAIFGHPDGHQIHVNKSALSSKLKKDLSSIQNFEEGGEVQDDSLDAKINSLKNLDEQDAEKQSKDALSAEESRAKMAKLGEYNELAAKRGLPVIWDSGKGTQYDIAEQPGPQPPALDTPEVPKSAVPEMLPGSAPQPTPSAAVAGASPSKNLGSDNYLGQYQEALKGQQAGIQKEAEAQGQLGQEQANILQPAIQQKQDAMAQYQNNVSKLSDEYGRFMNDYQNQHIDPNHYLNSMGVGQRVATGIGLLLGGFNARGDGKNVVLDDLNNSIARDVDAQKMELGKKENLLTANYRQFGNINQAAQMTNAMQQGIVSHQLEMAAAKSADPLAKARAMQAANQLKMSSLQTIRQMSLQQTMMDQLNHAAQPGQTGADPAAKISAMQVAGLASPEEAKEAGKALQGVKNHSQQRDNIISSFDKASQENTLFGRAGRLGASPPSIGVLQSNMMPYLKDAEGRINEQELIRTDKLIPSPGDRPSTVQEKRQGLIQFLQDKEPDVTILHRFGINPEQFGKFDRNGRPKLEKKAPVR